MKKIACFLSRRERGTPVVPLLSCCHQTMKLLISCFVQFLINNKLTFCLSGGVRGAGFVHSPLLSTKGRVSMEMMHVTDWLPTLYSLAGGDIHDLGVVDGFDMWETLSNATESPRKEILHNIDPMSGYSALRFGDWKLIVNASTRSKPEF